MKITMQATHDDLVRYADRQLDPAREQQLLQTAVTDAGLAEKLTALRKSRLPYRQAFDHKLPQLTPCKLRINLVQVLSTLTDNHDSANDSNLRLKLRIAVPHQGLAGQISEFQHLALAILLNRHTGADAIDLTTGWQHHAWLHKAQILNTPCNHFQRGPDLTAYGYLSAQCQSHTGSNLHRLLYIHQTAKPMVLCYKTQVPVSREKIIINNKPIRTIEWCEHNVHCVLATTESRAVCREICNAIQQFFLTRNRHADNSRAFH